MGKPLSDPRRYEPPPHRSTTRLTAALRHTSLLVFCGATYAFAPVALLVTELPWAGLMLDLIR